MKSSNNTRIAKNAIYLYIRTFVVMFVSLYTSRLVLKVLGVEDLGIYNVVGGIVALMSFLQNAQTKSTSRFITYELGRNAEEKTLTRVFSQCMTIHILLAIGAVVIGETVGLYIVNNWTNIPYERWFATQCVYQFAIFTFCIHIIRVPYDAVIVAHEDMSVYAYMSLFEAAIQLLMVWILTMSSTDNLILYAGLMMLIALILFFCYMLYVKNRRKIYKFSWRWDRDECKKILSFSGWTLLGAGANTATQQGVSLLFNNFVGLVANTALGFAGQVNIAVGRFVNSFTTAFNPQIIKYEAQKDKKSLFILMNRASKFSFALCYIMALPLIVNMDFVLSIWLIDVPQYTVIFCQLILICTIIDATTGVFNISITATGKIKNYQCCIALSFLLDFICSFILLKIGMNPAIVFASRIMTRGVINMIIGLYFTKKLIEFPLTKYVKESLFPILLTLIITIPISVVHIGSGLYRLILNIIICILITLLCVLSIIMNKNERKTVFKIIKSKYGRNCRI